MNKQKTYFENLDALRFFAFLAVFLLHRFHKLFSQYHHPVLQNWDGYKWLSAAVSSGHLGVNFFFVLSGFLITFLLLKERGEHGKIRLFYFYARRFLRIWPLYFLIVIIGFFIYPLAYKSLINPSYTESANLLYYLTFLGNFDIVKNGLPTGFDGLGILWSIAIEEQFYIFWPLILMVIPKQKLPVAFAAIILLSIIFRFVHYNNYLTNYFHSLSVVSDLCIGALFAWLIIYKIQVKHYFEKLDRKVIVGIYILGLLLCLFRFWVFSVQLMIALERVILGLFFAFVILEQNYAIQSFFKFGRLKLISYLGKISYGLYCYHIIAIMLSYFVFKAVGYNHNIFAVILAETIVALFLTIFFANISYKYFERPFLRLKNKFS